MNATSEVVVGGNGNDQRSRQGSPTPSLTSIISSSSQQQHRERDRDREWDRDRERDRDHYSHHYPQRSSRSRSPPPVTSIERDITYQNTPYSGLRPKFPKLPNEKPGEKGGSYVPNSVILRLIKQVSTFIIDSIPTAVVSTRHQYNVIRRISSEDANNNNKNEDLVTLVNELCEDITTLAKQLKQENHRLLQQGYQLAKQRQQDMSKFEELKQKLLDTKAKFAKERHTFELTIQRERDKVLRLKYEDVEKKANLDLKTHELERKRRELSEREKELERGMENLRKETLRLEYASMHRSNATSTTDKNHETSSQALVLANKNREVTTTRHHEPQHRSHNNSSTSGRQLVHLPKKW